MLSFPALRHITNHKRVIFVTLCALAIIAPFVATYLQQSNAPDSFAATPTWEQDFTRMDNGAPDPAYWSYDLNPLTPTYNDEAQAYTDSKQNIRITDGKLVIEAKRQDYKYPGYGKNYRYTSGKLILRPQDEKLGENSKAFAYGKIVARLKLPKGAGTWPAFWMLSDTQPHTSALGPTAKDWGKEGFYKHDGEIDIIEGYGKKDGSIVTEATVHTFNGPATGKTFHTPVQNSTSEFHDYGVELTPNEIRFSVDGTVYGSFRKSSGSTDDWFLTKNNKMYAILNLAMGGDGGGHITGNGPWQLEAESVKFYKYQK